MDMHFLSRCNIRLLHVVVAAILAACDKPVPVVAETNASSLSGEKVVEEDQPAPGHRDTEENTRAITPQVLALPSVPSSVLGVYHGQTEEKAVDNTGQETGRHFDVHCKLEIYQDKDKLVIKETYNSQLNGKSLLVCSYTMTPSEVGDSFINASLTPQDFERLDAKLKRPMQSLIGKEVKIAFQQNKARFMPLYFGKELELVKEADATPARAGDSPASDQPGAAFEPVAETKVNPPPAPAAKPAPQAPGSEQERMQRFAGLYEAQSEADLGGKYPATVQHVSMAIVPTQNGLRLHESVVFSSDGSGHALKANLECPFTCQEVAEDEISVAITADDWMKITPLAVRQDLVPQIGKLFSIKRAGGGIEYIPYWSSRPLKLKRVQTSSNEQDVTIVASIQNGIAATLGLLAHAYLGKYEAALEPDQTGAFSPAGVTLTVESHDGVLDVRERLQFGGSFRRAGPPSFEAVYQLNVLEVTPKTMSVVLSSQNWAKIDNLQVKEALRAKVGAKRTIKKVPGGLALPALWKDQEIILKYSGP